MHGSLGLAHLITQEDTPSLCSHCPQLLMTEPIIQYFSIVTPLLPKVIGTRGNLLCSQAYGRALEPVSSPISSASTAGSVRVHQSLQLAVASAYSLVCKEQGTATHSFPPHLHVIQGSKHTLHNKVTPEIR